MLGEPVDLGVFPTCSDKQKNTLLLNMDPSKYPHYIMVGNNGW